MKSRVTCGISFAVQKAQATTILTLGEEGGVLM
jgi:hypothetical protein